MFVTYEDSVLHAADSQTGELSASNAHKLLIEHGFTMNDIITEFGRPIYCAATLLECLGY